MVLRTHAPRSNWLVAPARVSLGRVPPTGVASSPNSSLFPPCRHDCISRNIKSARRSHLGPLHHMHGSTSDPLRQPAPPRLDWCPAKLQFGAFLESGIGQRQRPHEAARANPPAPPVSPQLPCHPAHLTRTLTASPELLTCPCHRRAPPHPSGRTWLAFSATHRLQRTLRPSPG
jgi:hypothetical protein